jgi:hypothetical protein
VHKEAGRPWPIICPEDDVIDYMVMEAVAIRTQKADEKAAKAEKRKRWKKEPSEQLLALA